MPLMELIEEILTFSGFLEKQVDLAYISGIKEAAFDFVSKNRADLQGFLDWWELNHPKRTVKIPEDHDAMRILTIHKSKGLQYKVVVMPFLDWKIVATGNQAPILWSEYSISEQLRTVLPITHSSSLKDSQFKSMYQDEVRLAYLDSLNMLYVAFTRAEEVIWGFSEYSQTQAGVISGKQTGNMLFKLFKDGFERENFDSRPYWNEDETVFDWGDWPKIELEKVGRETPTKEIRWNSSPWASKLKTREYAWDFSGAGVEARAQRKLGLLVHEILEEANDLPHALNLIQQLTFEGRLDAETGNELHAQMRLLFDTPEFQRWYKSDFQVLAEQGILLPGGKQKRPDRILIGKEKALVIDFKTGEKKESHRQQVLEYMYLVHELSQLPVEGFVCYLDPTEIIAIHE